MIINPTFYPVAWENLPFAMTLSVTGGVGPFNWSAAGLPAGLSVTDAVNGIISGTPVAGTCGIYTVTATVTDTGTCCCPPVSRPFILIVDCWANYPIIFYYTTSCDFNVEIGPGLTQGQTNVLVDGAHEATLVGGQSEVFTSQPCQSHLVMVDQTVQVPNSNTRFSVIGSNTKTVTDTDNYAYFNYAQEVYIQTASDPSGVAQPPGIGFYAVGSNFSSTTPGTIESNIQNGIKYVFREWKLPDGTTRPTRDLVFTVNQGGTATAAYDTFYLLTLKSDYPAIDERSWERQGSTATWNLSLHAVPLLGFWGGLGGVQSPLNASGSQLITGPTTVEIMWGPNYTMPIIAIVIILLVIAGLIYLIYRLRARPTRPATSETKAPAKAKPVAKSEFCPKCGNRLGKDAEFCSKCGKKLK
jgi:ribosomal protein L40E